MKKLLFALAIALAPALAAAQPRGVMQFPLAIDYDLDSTSFVYPVSQGKPLASGAADSRVSNVLETIKSNVRITTSGAESTTVTAAVASSAPFAAVQAGDFIRFRTGDPGGLIGKSEADQLHDGQVPWLKVVTRTNANSITVNQAVFIPTTGVPFEWRRVLTSSQIGYGWVPTRSFDVAKFSVKIDQQNTTTGISVQVQCRDDLPGLDTLSEHIVYPYPGATCNFGTLDTSECVFTGAGALNNLVVTIDNAGAWQECRVGLKLDSTDDGNDLTTNLELIRVDFVGYSKGGTQ